MTAHVADFKDLEVWQVAMQLVAEVYRLAPRLPRDERFGLALQIRRSSTSIPSNIAEGYGRRSRAEYIRFLNIANGSLKELETQLLLVDRLELLPATAVEEPLKLCGSVARLLTALTRRLKE